MFFPPSPPVYLPTPVDSAPVYVAPSPPPVVVDKRERDIYLSYLAYLVVVREQRNDAYLSYLSYVVVVVPIAVVYYYYYYD